MALELSGLEELGISLGLPRRLGQICLIFLRSLDGEEQAGFSAEVSWEQLPLHTSLSAPAFSRCFTQGRTALGRGSGGFQWKGRVLMGEGFSVGGSVRRGGFSRGILVVGVSGRGLEWGCSGGGSVEEFCWETAALLRVCSAERGWQGFVFYSRLRTCLLILKRREGREREGRNIHPCDRETSM